MKFYHIILILLLIVYINTEDDCDDIKNPSSKKDCNGKLSSNDKEKKYTHCCFLENDGQKACLSFTQKEFDDIEKNMKEAKDKGEKVGSIECNSSYIKIGLLSLLFAVL